VLAIDNNYQYFRIIIAIEKINCKLKQILSEQFLFRAHDWSKDTATPLENHGWTRIHTDFSGNGSSAWTH